MALNKDYVNKQELVTLYHRVNNVMFRDGVLKCTLFSYPSQEIREAAKNRPMTITNFTFNITAEEEESMGIRALCYKKIKELPDWADAEDC
jgi:hypothetical protein